MRTTVIAVFLLGLLAFHCEAFTKNSPSPKEWRPVNQRQVDRRPRLTQPRYTQATISTLPTFFNVNQGAAAAGAANPRPAPPMPATAGRKLLKSGPSFTS